MAAATTERAASPPHAASAFGLPRLLPTLPMNVFNSINPFATTEAGKTAPETKESADSTAFFKRPIFASLLGRPAATAEQLPPPPSHQRNDSQTVMFAEPVAEDSDDVSRDGSVSAQRRRKSRNKPKTTFSICHPPPASVTRHKLHRRPRSLLQLHRLSANARPIPAYEVIPSANFSARLTKSIIKTYKTKHGLCINDLVVLRAEKYYTEEHEDEQDSQDILALICRGRVNETATFGKAKICMSNGGEWEAQPHSSGGYEFYTTDDHGLGITVRWVPKKSKDSSKTGHRKFNFSTIAQNTRRHPVIATLSDTGLDVYDTYKVPDPAVSTPLSTPVHQDSFLAQAMDDEDVQANDECVTDERLRSIITVTAIYVTVSEGWSPYIKYEDKEAASKSTSSPQKDGLVTPVSTPPGSPMQQALEKRGSVRSVGSGLLRRSSMLSRANRDSTVSVDSINSTDTATKTGRTRSDSASTVLVQRAASNRRRTNQQATWRPDLLSAQNTVPETSREDLSRGPKSPRLSTIDSSASRKPSKPDVQHLRTASVAEDTEETDEEDASPTERKDDKDSSATSEVHSEAAAAPQSETSRRSTNVRKSSRWKRIFCIS